MTNYRKILEMFSQGHSQRSIEANVHSSHQTVKAVLDRAKVYIPLRLPQLHGHFAHACR